MLSHYDSEVLGILLNQSNNEYWHMHEVHFAADAGPFNPKALNQWHYMACAIIAFVGGLFGVVLGNSFINEFYTAYPVNSRYWQVSICPTAPL